MRLAGKVAIITGAGRGIGQATAVKFAREGAVVAVCDVDEKTSSATARMIEGLGGKAFASVTGSVAAVTAAVDACAAMIGRKGLLVNKVVIPQPRPELLNEMI